LRRKTPEGKRDLTGIGTGGPVVITIRPPQLRALDGWIAQQKPRFPSCPGEENEIIKAKAVVRSRGAPSEKLINRKVSAQDIAKALRQIEHRLLWQQ